jgi:alpha-L-rhamnosidase
MSILFLLIPLNQLVAMKRFFFFCLICSLSLFTPTYAQYSTEKPWTFWWWMGSAVTREDIKFQLQNFAKSGLGGVYIIPIYGAKGYEKQFIPFLSKEWLGMLDFTVQEGATLGLGVDLTTGTGWPFGGPNVTKEMAAKKWQLRENNELASVLTKQAVKRAALGGEGLVLDHFSKSATETYLMRFDSAFATLKHKPRAMYSDSYEVYGANWTDNLLKEFNYRKGYVLQDSISPFLDSTKSLSSTLVKMDYQEVMADLLADNFANTWTAWSAKKGFLTRYQAHGSPANLLDLYGFSDIPETESFGTSRFTIPNLRIDEDYEVERFGTPSPLAMKFASSPAHLLGKKLVSSESTTWLANHFKVSLSQIKPQIDELFTSGINHVFYHGTTYSPQSEGEGSPGWLFYASTNFGLKSHFYKHLPLLNKYIEHCQQLLQNSRPDNDILVYFPIYDIWANLPKNKPDVQLLTVHVDKWILDMPFGQLTQDLIHKGFSLDYVSDKQIKALQVRADGAVYLKEASYKTIVVPSCEYMPLATLEALDKLAEQGAKIIFQSEFPNHVTGLLHYAREQAKAKEILQSNKSFIKTTNMVKTLQEATIRQETWASVGLSFIRKKYKGEEVYFISNLKNDFKEGWIQLSAQGRVYQKYNPLQDTFEALPTKIVHGDRLHYLNLASGESCFLMPSKQQAVANVPSAFMSETLQGNWHIDFLEGKPAIKTSSILAPATSWTTLSDSAALFSGTVRYTMSFDVQQQHRLEQCHSFVLDLGDVREVAEVKLNGKTIGTAWCLPFQVTIPKGILKKKGNQLAIKVTNLSANYMRLYDKLHPEWKKFYDINIVDIRYRPLDISTWQPMPSGLLSKVKLMYR